MESKRKRQKSERILYIAALYKLVPFDRSSKKSKSGKKSEKKVRIVTQDS